MNRSDDDGAMTWMPVDRPIALQRGGWAHEIPALGRANGMPISYFAPNGTWHLIYGEQDSTKSWVSHATSTDRGENWSQPSRLPVPDSIRHHFMPWFAIDASNGTLHVLAYGQTASMPTPKRFFGDYSGIAARNGDVHAVWTEQREGVNELVYGRFADPALDETIVNTPTKKRRKK
jgi:hypothetical protein